MEKRTEGEIRAIVKRCVEIEKQGGDVLAYLRSENYISPGATWWNFQKGYLNRKTAQITNGKPKAKAFEHKEEKHMDETGKKVPKDQFPETARTAVNIALSGISPMKYLKEKGYLYPAQAWKRIKDWCMANDPESYAKLPKNIKVLKQPKTKTPEDFQKKYPGGVLKMKPPELPAEPPKLEVQDEVTAWPEKPSPTCCQPAKPSGVSVPDDLPEEITDENFVKTTPETITDEQLLETAKTLRKLENRLKISGVSTKQGTWTLKKIDGKKYVQFKQAERSDLQICMEPNDWIKFAYDSLAALIKLEALGKDENTGD